LEALKRQQDFLISDNPKKREQKENTRKELKDKIDEAEQ